MFPRTRSLTLSLAAFVAANGLLAACSDTAGPPVVARVVIQAPAAQPFYPGQSLQLVATARDAADRVLQGEPISYASSNPAVANVGAATGLVTAVAPGSTRITATSGGASGHLDLTVLPVPVASVSATPTTTDLHVAWTQAITVELRDAQGVLLTERAISFTSSNTNVAGVSATGVITGVWEGEATITIASEGITDQVAVTVTHAPVQSIQLQPDGNVISDGMQLQLAATLLDARGNVISRPIMWSTSDAAIALVSGLGKVSGVAPGQVTITAASGGHSASVVVHIQPHVETVVVSPTAATLRVGDVAVLTIVLRDADGGILSNRPTTFSVSNPAVVAYLADGSMRALDEGTSTITIRSESASATSVITVIRPVAIVTVSPASATVPVGTQVQLVVTLYDERGQVLTGRPINYSSSSPAVATVDASGVVTGRAKGIADITVESEGITRMARITVP